MTAISARAIPLWPWRCFGTPFRSICRHTPPHENTSRINDLVQLENIEEGTTISCNAREAIDPQYVQRKRQIRLFKRFAQELIETAFPPKTNLRPGKA
jgi:hypothetical protein